MKQLWLPILLVAMLAPAALADQPIHTTMQIAVSPTSIAVGDAATVTATLKPDAGEVGCGNGHIQYSINSGTWLDLAHNLDVVANQFSATFDTSTISVAVGDVITFRAGYSSSGRGCDFENQAIGESPTTELHIVAAATACPDNQTTGVHITIEGPNGDGMPSPGESGSWSFIVRVLACEDLAAVTAQGGSNGWSNPKYFVASAGTVTELAKNRNTVYAWNIGPMAEGTSATLEITSFGTIKNSPSECGKIKTLNGDWSAVYSADGVTSTKSAYTSYKSTIEVTCQ